MKPCPFWSDGAKRNLSGGVKSNLSEIKNKLAICEPTAKMGDRLNSNALS